MYFGNNIDKDAFKKYINQLPAQKPSACGNCVNSDTSKSSTTKHSCCCGDKTKKSCGCGDDGECKDCACKKKKKSRSPLDDGCFCRKCNSFLPMVEPDDEGDGKTLCYGCKNPW
jgi:hypothetical protein